MIDLATIISIVLLIAAGMVLLFMTTRLQIAYEQWLRRRFKWVPQLPPTPHDRNIMVLVGIIVSGALGFGLFYLAERWTHPDVSVFSIPHRRSAN